jgi:hypothetical protein
MKPDYRFVCHIVDQTTGNIVISGSTYVSSIDRYGQCESVDTEVGAMLRSFERKIREQYERENYQPEESAV